MAACSFKERRDDTFELFETRVYVFGLVYFACCNFQFAFLAIDHNLMAALQGLMHGGLVASAIANFATPRTRCNLYPAVGLPSCQLEEELTSRDLFSSSHNLAVVISCILHQHHQRRYVAVSTGFGLEQLSPLLQMSTCVEIPVTAIFDHADQKALIAFLEPLVPRPSNATTNNTPSCSVSDQIVALLVAMTGDEAVGPTSTFMSVGLDSLGIVDLQRELSQLLDMQLPASALFDYPSATELGSFIERHRRQTEPSNHHPLKIGVTDDLASSLKRAYVPNPRAPKLTLSGYYTVPSIKRLARMTDKELEAVPRFVIGKKALGEVAFMYPVNLLDASLDDGIEIRRGRIKLLAHQLSFHGPALLTFRQIFPRHKFSALEVEGFIHHLERQSSKLGSLFVHYDPEKGIWVMKIET